MAKTVMGGCYKLTAVGDSILHALNCCVIRVVNAAAAGDVILLEPGSDNEYWKSKAVGANEEDESNYFDRIPNGLKVGTIPAGCEIFIYFA